MLDTIQCKLIEIFTFQYFSAQYVHRDFRDETMDDKLIYITNDDKQNYSFC